MFHTSIVEDHPVAVKGLKSTGERLRNVVEGPEGGGCSPWTRIKVGRGRGEW